MPDLLTDWAVIGFVIALAILVYVGMSNMIDGLIDYWRSRKDNP